MASKERSEKCKGRMTLLEHGREIRTEATSGLSARPTAKTAGDFLLNFDHTNVTFDEIIVERHGKIIDKGKDLAALKVEAFSQIACFGLLGATAFAFGPASGRRGGGGEGLRNKLLIEVVDASTRVGWEGGFALSFGLVDLCFDGKQEMLELSGPGLAELLMQR